MTVYELVEQLGGEIVRGQARIRQGRDYIILGKLNGDTMEFTKEGRELAAGPEPKAEEPVKRTRKSKQPESEPVVEKLDIDDNIQLDLD